MFEWVIQTISRVPHVQSTKLSAFSPGNGSYGLLESVVVKLWLSSLTFKALAKLNFSLGPPSYVTYY